MKSSDLWSDLRAEPIKVTLVAPKKVRGMIQKCCLPCQTLPPFREFETISGKCNAFPRVLARD